MFDNFPKAVHQPGGNYYDDVKLDLNASHESVDSHEREKKNEVRSYIRSRLSYYLQGFLIKAKLYDSLVHLGVCRGWFTTFTDYWSNVIQGRPINVSEFFLLTHDYRKKQQHVKSLVWTSPEQHVDNWQASNEFYNLLHSVRKIALRPIIARHLWKHVRSQGSILEYGCSLAPYYYCYRRFFSYKRCKWCVADIPNHAFHYAKHLYSSNHDVEFTTILESNFKTPLKNNDVTYDVIILTTVLEHLDDPEFVIRYLLDRLKSGGLLVFDYVISEGQGLDTPAALAQRKGCLRIIQSNTELLAGKIAIDENVGLCLARKI